MTSSTFEEWLCGVLEAAGADGEVYGGYISGSLAAMTASSREEIEETVQDILSGLLEDEGVCREMCGRIVGEWVRREAERLAAEALEETEKDKDHNMGLPVASGRGGREGKKNPDSLSGGLTASDKKLLVAQYGDLSNDEDDLDDMEDDPGGGGASGSSHTHYQAPTMAAVFENMNARLVNQAEREKREKDKVSHEVKVERDRKNREGQKQKALDRKEKEKKRTQKQERRR